jgi:hypothetical protein
MYALPIAGAAGGSFNGGCSTAAATTQSSVARLSLWNTSF